jgi:hypothetical protein
MNLLKLTVHCYAENPLEERRITLSLHKIDFLSAASEDIIINGRSLRPVSVIFDEGLNCDLIVNHADLETLEAAVGAYCLD